MSEQQPRDDEIEQHADGEADPSDLDPQAEYRSGSGFVVSKSGRIERSGRRRNWTRGSDPGIETDIEPVPNGSKDAFQEYFVEFAITQAALRTFDDLVLEPEWEVTAKRDDEVDEEMTEALELWGKNCTIRAGEPGHDINNILSECPSGRRTKPAVLIEKIGTTDDPDAIAALQLVEPWNMSARFRADQNLVVQPGDDVPRNHPTVEREGETVPAAYVQYDDAVSRFGDADEDAIPFAEDDIIKVTYEPPEGSAWGRTIWPAIAEPIDGLKQKLRDRNTAIRLTGHPHRIYSSDSWSKEEAASFADMHEEGQSSAWDLPEEREKMSYAGRVDYVPHTVEIEVEDGDVADISDAVKDDLEQIFSILPLGKHNIAYVDELNRFVVEQLNENDDRTIDKERRYLESVFGDLFSEKADGLADGEYPGEVEFHIRQPESDNPLERADFNPERVTELVKAFTEYAKSGASAEFPRELPYFFAGMNREDFEKEFADAEMAPRTQDENEDENGEGEEPATDDEIDEEDPDVQEAAEQMGVGIDTTPDSRSPAPADDD